MSYESKDNEMSLNDIDINKDILALNFQVLTFQVRYDRRQIDCKFGRCIL